MSEVTVRMPVRTSVGGSSVRIRLTNAYATDPVTIGHATVGLRDSGSAVARPYDVRFGGKRGVTIPAGGAAVSDPVRLAVPALTDLMVSLHLPGQVTHITDHWWAQQTVYWTDYGAGDHAADTTGDAYTWTTTSWPFLSGVDVTAPRTGSVVALGDSITDGAQTTRGANRRWPDVLARRFQADRGLRHLGVVNAGISGNRVLADDPRRGASGLNRFDRDVLGATNVKAVVIDLGINDILRGEQPAAPRSIVAGLRTLTDRAHAHGVKVVGATLTPFRGHRGYTAAREDVRQRVNAAIRAGGVFDEVVDFDKALRDPYDPRSLRAEYDSGDHLHPSDRGYRKLALTVVLPKPAGSAPAAL
jgi:lysophospholipase L1-like esterase